MSWKVISSAITCPPFIASRRIASTPGSSPVQGCKVNIPSEARREADCHFNSFAFYLSQEKSRRTQRFISDQSSNCQRKERDGTRRCWLITEPVPTVGSLVLLHHGHEAVSSTRITWTTLCCCNHLTGGLCCELCTVYDRVRDNKLDLIWSEITRSTIFWEHIIQLYLKLTHCSD